MVSAKTEDKLASFHVPYKIKLAHFEVYLIAILLGLLEVVIS